MFELNEVLDLQENGLNFAFMVQNSNDKLPREDPNFVEWKPKLVISDGDIDLEVILL
jgi:hypothetical protein